MSQTYSFLDTNCSISGPGGNFSLSNVGNAEEGITVSPEETNSMTGGADGQVMHNLHASRRGTVTVRLLKTSPANGQLSALFNTQSGSSALWGANTIVINDTGRGDSITCTQVAFRKRPDITYAVEGGTNEWEFDCGRIDMQLTTAA